jgi:gas vesicle protein
MIVAVVAALLFAPPSAKADNDFTLVWTVGEASRDFTRSTTTWTLTGGTLTVTS